MTSLFKLQYFYNWRVNATIKRSSNLNEPLKLQSYPTSWTGIERGQFQAEGILKNRLKNGHTVKKSRNQL